MPQVAGKGGVLLAAKVLRGVLAALAVGHFLGTEPVKTGLLAGLSTLAVVAWTAGLAAAATAGNAAAAPAATVLVAASVVVTMLSVPLVTARWVKRVVSTV